MRLLLLPRENVDAGPGPTLRTAPEAIGAGGGLKASVVAVGTEAAIVADKPTPLAMYLPKFDAKS